MKHLKYINEETKFSLFPQQSDFTMSIDRANSHIDHMIKTLGMTTYHIPKEDTVITADGMKSILNDIAYIQSVLLHIKQEVKKK